jgi:hypothetical protein
MELQETFSLFHVSNFFALIFFFFFVLLANYGLYWADAMQNLIRPTVLVCNPPIPNFI